MCLLGLDLQHECECRTNVKGDAPEIGHESYGSAAKAKYPTRSP